MNQDDTRRIQELVNANHILAMQGILDVYGHVSVRSSDPERFLLSRSLAPALVTAEDIQLFDLDAATTDPQPSYVERFIHSAIYKTRPEVHAVVHSHAPAVIPFTVTGQEIRAVMHVAGFLADGVAHWDIRDESGDGTDLLIRDAELGQKFAERMNLHSVALMRGHGFVTVARSLKLATFQAIYTPLNAQLLMEALRLGPVTHLSPAEGASAWATNAAQVDRAWDAWMRRLASNASP